MKRLWFGVGLLLLLAALGFLTAWGMLWIHEPVSDTLSNAGQAALEEDWERALDLSAQAYQRWKHYRKLTAAVADHEPMEGIDSLFCELEVYGKEQEAEHFAACCANLCVLNRAVGEAHEVNWWNLL